MAGAISWSESGVSKNITTVIVYIFFTGIFHLTLQPAHCLVYTPKRITGRANRPYLLSQWPIPPLTHQPSTSSRRREAATTYSTMKLFRSRQRNRRNLGQSHRKILRQKSRRAMVAARRFLLRPLMPRPLRRGRVAQNGVEEEGKGEVVEDEEHRGRGVLRVVPGVISPVRVLPRLRAAMAQKSLQSPRRQRKRMMLHRTRKLPVLQTETKVRVCLLFGGIGVLREGLRRYGALLPS